MNLNIMNDGKRMIEALQSMKGPDAALVRNLLSVRISRPHPMYRMVFVIHPAEDSPRGLLQPYMCTTPCEPYVLLTREEVAQEMYEEGLLSRKNPLSDAEFMKVYREYTRDDVTDRYGNVLSTCPRYGNIELLQDVREYEGFLTNLDKRMNGGPLACIQFPFHMGTFHLMRQLVATNVTDKRPYLSGLPNKYRDCPLDEFAIRCITAGWLLPSFDAFVDYTGLWMNVEHCQRGEIISKFCRRNFEFSNIHTNCSPEYYFMASLLYYKSA